MAPITLGTQGNLPAHLEQQGSSRALPLLPADPETQAGCETAATPVHPPQSVSRARSLSRGSQLVGKMLLTGGGRGPQGSVTLALLCEHEFTDHGATRGPGTHQMVVNHFLKRVTQALVLG